MAVPIIWDAYNLKEKNKMNSKILIVDDRQENLFAIESILKKLDVHIIKANSGNEALAKTIHYDLALILLDVQMPEMDGYEVAELLRMKEETKHIPIIFITAIDRDDKREMQGYESGAIDFIFKPIDNQILIGKVRIFLQLYENQLKLKMSVKTLEEEITKRKKLEHEIIKHRDHLQEMVDEQTVDLKEAKEAAEAASLLKDQFLNMVSHELRTPLTTMLGPLGIIVDELSELDLSDAKEMAELAEKSAERMLLIVEDLLCVTRMEAGNMEFHNESENVADMVRQAVKTNTNLAEKYGAEFVLEDLVDANIMVDSDRFGQVMTNILSNAVKYGITPENKQVTVSASCYQNNIVRIQVADRGKGIPEDFQPYVFNRFTMADSSDVREKGGLGLGMLITKGFVKHMGGEIGFESKTDKGTTFWLRFPELKNS